jgi:hypothetical protein
MARFEQMEDEIIKAYRDAGRTHGAVYDRKKGRVGCLFFWTEQVYLEEDTQCDTWHWYNKTTGRVSRSFDIGNATERDNALNSVVMRDLTSGEYLLEMANTIYAGILSDLDDGFSTHEHTIERILSCLKEVALDADPLKA